MKIIAIISENTKQVVDMRREMIRGGIIWRGGSKSPGMHKAIKYLTLIIAASRMVASFGIKSVLTAIDFAQENDYEIITATKFLNDPTIIPGWKDPKLEVMLPTPWGPTSLDLSPIVSVLKKHFNEEK